MSNDPSLTGAPAVVIRTNRARHHADRREPALPQRTGRTQIWDPGVVVDDRYTVLGRIGSGGTANVYCAGDIRLRRKVALKVLRPELAYDHLLVDRFRREARTVASLPHPHIVTVYDRGVWEGTDYIAMEYVRGRSLRSLIEREAPLPPSRAIDLTVQLLEAAGFIHRRGIIHRDLKPENVIVGNGGRLRVTDFGIACPGPSRSDETRRTVLGTASYLSPEQALGGVLTAASDLYSIGIILYELVVRRVPFEDERAVAVARKHIFDQPVPPGRFCQAVTPELDAIIMRALEKAPARRFPDAETLIASLEHVKARSEQRPYQWRKHCE